MGRVLRPYVTRGFRPCLATGLAPHSIQPPIYRNPDQATFISQRPLACRTEQLEFSFMSICDRDDREAKVQNRTQTL
jgi:hypothetical protein